MFFSFCFRGLVQFASFARGFAPLRGSIGRVCRLVEAPYFVGFATSIDAERLLSTSLPGTYVNCFKKHHNENCYH